jgi:hypothetical protein
MPALRQARTGGGRTNRSSESRHSSRPPSQAVSRPCTSFGDFPKIETKGSKPQDDDRTTLKSKSPVPKTGIDSHASNNSDRLRPSTSWDTRKSNLDRKSGMNQDVDEEPNKHRSDSGHDADADAGITVKKRNTDTPSSVSSWASSVLDSKVVDFQKSFLVSTDPSTGTPKSPHAHVTPSQNQTAACARAI